MGRWGGQNKMELTGSSLPLFFQNPYSSHETNPTGSRFLPLSWRGKKATSVEVDYFSCLFSMATKFRNGWICAESLQPTLPLTVDCWALVEICITKAMSFPYYVFLRTIFHCPIMIKGNLCAYNFESRFISTMHASSRLAVSYVKGLTKHIQSSKHFLCSHATGFILRMLKKERKLS